MCKVLNDTIQYHSENGTTLVNATNQDHNNTIVDHHSMYEVLHSTMHKTYETQVVNHQIYYAVFDSG